MDFTLGGEHIGNITSIIEAPDAQVRSGHRAADVENLFNNISSKRPADLFRTRLTGENCDDLLAVHSREETI